MPTAGRSGMRRVAAGPRCSRSPSRWRTSSRPSPSRARRCAWRSPSSTTAGRRPPVSSSRRSSILTGSGPDAAALRRDRHRRRAQRARPRGVSRPRGQAGAGPGAPPAGGRGGGHRGSLPRIQVLGVLLRREPAPAGDHPRPRAAASRPRDPAARKHAHSFGERRLPRDVERSRSDPSRAVPPLGARCRGLRRVRAADAPHGHGGKPILGMVPPDPTSLSPGDLLGLARLAKHFPGLGERHFHALCKLMTMSSADFLDEWFEFDGLKATKAASGIIGTFLGPRSPGTAYVLLHHYMGEIDGAFRAWGFAKGGTGAISEAIAAAARARGAEIRTEAPVARIRISRVRPTGVVLTTGDELAASVVGSGPDPRRTVLQLVG